MPPTVIVKLAGGQLDAPLTVITFALVLTEPDAMVVPSSTIIGDTTSSFMVIVYVEPAQSHSVMPCAAKDDVDINIVASASTYFIFVTPSDVISKVADLYNHSSSLMTECYHSYRCHYSCCV